MIITWLPERPDVPANNPVQDNTQTFESAPRNLNRRTITTSINVGEVCNQPKDHLRGAACADSR